MVSLAMPQFRILLNPLQLWPAIPIAIFIGLIRKIIDNSLTATANRITQQNINLSKPRWFTSKTSIGCDSNNFGYTIPAQSQLDKIQYLIRILTEKEFNKLRDYGIEINLTYNQIRELKSYFDRIKQFDIQKNKFLESIFKLAAIVPIAIYGIYVCYFKNDFFMNHWNQWIHIGDNIKINDNKCIINYKNEPLIQEYDEYMLYYYIISLGYHLNRALMQFNNPTRKDFVALIIHHWTTLALMICSFVGGKLRTGCITLAIHEYSDILLEAAKLCKYMSFQLGADIGFVLFLISWVIFRIYCFCHKLLYSIMICGIYTCFMGDAALVFSYINLVFLYILQGIHIYWFRLILKVVRNKLSGREVSDVRSSGGESDNDGMIDKYHED